MRFFFPDSQDQIDPSFDFQSERASEFRVRQRDDLYAHEILRQPAYDGLLLSKPIVDGLAGTSGKYTVAQRHRLYRLGVRQFFRLDQASWPIMTMGDCGGFTYVRDETPPYTVDEVIDFYERCSFDQGVSVDHVILGYDRTDTGASVPQWRNRQQLTLELAADFLRSHRARHCEFAPLGVAQGWSPVSYAHAVNELQRIGYRYVALGGMVPLKTVQIVECLRAVQDIRLPEVQLHLLGISRCDRVPELASLGVSSFDSTSPFRQAFKDDKDNYYTPGRNFLAIRVPQVEGNPKLKAAILAGRVDQARARTLEQLCLQRLAKFDRGETTVGSVLDALTAYGDLLEVGQHDLVAYRELLEAAPWRSCRCGICHQAGIQVVIFRGTERNKRRGFHNLYVFGQSLKEHREGSNPYAVLVCDNTASQESQ